MITICAGSPLYRIISRISCDVRRTRTGARIHPAQIIATAIYIPPFDPPGNQYAPIQPDCPWQCDRIIRFTTNLSPLKKGSPVNPPDTRMKDYLKESYTTYDPAEVVTNTEKVPPDNDDIYS